MSADDITLMKDLLDVWGPTTKPLHAYVIGGVGAMNDSMFRSISAGVANAKSLTSTKLAADDPDAPAVARIGGADRYITSQMIVDKLKTAYSSTVIPFADNQQAVFATGLNFPDALAGSAYAAASNSAMWVIPSSCVFENVFVTANKLNLLNYGLLGGTGVLSEKVDTLTTC
jgi:hypothetical protein